MRKRFILCSFIMMFFICFTSGCKRNNAFKDGVYEGKYTEETQYATYTAHVEVTVKNNKIEKVILKESNIHSPSSSWSDYTIWTENYQKLLDSFVGIDAKKVADSKTSPVDAISGATLSSNRLYEAVKLALK